MTQVQTPPFCGIFYFFYRFPKQFKHLTSIVNIGAKHQWCSTIPVVEDKSFKTQYQVSYVLVEAM